ncbi:helix-turn-helix domain-containing protein [Saliphagus infecundisoli]|uniref:Helix-turn-helix domain-containing protein n=1 Tax=Saliphagus infecundisoli TaxID=1849069 RepID=A0ABD5QFB8_9EURY
MIVGRLAEEGWTTPTELADALEMPTSTAHIYLKTMAEAGYLATADGGYRLIGSVTNFYPSPEQR